MRDLSFRPGKGLRLSEFINPEDGKSVILEADQGSMLGPMAGLVDLEETLKNLKNEVDAIVLSPGQGGRLTHLFLGREAPALLVRVDWANVFRGEMFVLPAQKIRHVKVASPGEALALGASAIVAFLLIGHEDDEDEARNIESIASLARESERLGAPLLVECIPFGGRVTETNYVACVDMAVRMAVEAGADAVAAPYTGNVGSFRRVIDAAKVPVFMFDVEDETQNLLGTAKEALDAGASGVIVGKRVLQADEPVKALKDLKDIVHQKLERNK